MIDVDITIFIQMVNFLITWMVLNLVLFRPIRGILKKRAEFMAGQLDAVEKFSTQAVSKLKDYEAKLDAARAEGVLQRTGMKDAALAEEHSIVADATKSVAGQVAAARTQVAEQFGQAKQALSNEVGRLAQKAVGKILA